MILHSNKLESPSSKNALCQVWLKLAQWFWRRGFFNVVNMFLLFCNYLPMEKSWALHLNKLESFTQEYFVSSLVEIGSVVLEKKIV